MHDNEQLWEEMRDLRQDVKEMRKELSGYKGFIGGVMWVISALSAAIGAGVTFVVKG